MARWAPHQALGHLDRACCSGWCRQAQVRPEHPAPCQHCQLCADRSADVIPETLQRLGTEVLAERWRLPLHLHKLHQGVAGTVPCWFPEFRPRKLPTRKNHPSEPLHWVLKPRHSPHGPPTELSRAPSRAEREEAGHLCRGSLVAALQSWFVFRRYRRPGWLHR